MSNFDFTVILHLYINYFQAFSDVTFELLCNVILEYFRMQIKTEKEVISGIYDYSVII